MADLEVRVLRSLVALADEGTVSGAAVKLHVSQPALSKQLALAERVTGVPLFERHARGVTPTEPGLLVLEHARRVLREIDGLAAAAASARRSLSGTLRLGFIAQAANELTPSFLREFGQRYPAVRVELRQYELSDLTAGLSSGETDLAFLRQPLAADGLHHEEILAEPRVAVLADTHPLAGEEEIDVAQLFADPWVVNASSDPSWQAYALATSQRGGRAPVLGPTVHSVDEFLEAVLGQGAVGLAPLSATRYYTRPGLRYVKVRDAEPSVCTLSWRAAIALSPSATAFIEVVRDLLPSRAVTP